MHLLSCPRDMSSACSSHSDVRLEQLIVLCRPLAAGTSSRDSALFRDYSKV